MNAASDPIVHDVLLFAGLRDALGASDVQVVLSPGATVGDLLVQLGLQHPALASRLQQCRVAVAQEFVDEGHVLRPDDEIAVIPPVSGGHDGPARRPKVHLTVEPLSLGEVVAAVEHPGAGGITTFTGNVRGFSRGHEIAHLDYEAYEPMALRVMKDIAARIESDIEGTRVAIHHRLGRLHVGQTAVVIAASAAHRQQAFDACRAAIEALKKDVPIWKREVSTEGATWIGQGP